MRSVSALVMLMAWLASAHAQDRARIWEPSAGHQQVPIWPGAVPDALPDPKPESLGPPPGREWWPRANDVSRPTMTVYAPQSPATDTAIVVCTRFAQRTYPPVDGADAISCRPDFAIVVYPGHLWTPGTELTLRPDIRVHSDTPPTFLLHAEDDPIDPVKHSLTYYAALQKAGVPVEMHFYAQGGHAFGLRPTKLPIGHWPALVEQWLHTIGMLGSRPGEQSHEN